MSRWIDGGVEGVRDDKDLQEEEGRDSSDRTTWVR
jgi:hypothetical protein